MAIDYSIFAIPKSGRPPKKARQRIRVRPVPKKERQQRDAVRAACVVRDGDCRLRLSPFMSHTDRVASPQMTLDCCGPSEWAHMHSRRRSKTRGMDPSYRHDTAHSLMLCQFHHQEYDAKRLVITALTRKGANGALKFRRAVASRPPLEAKA